MRRVLACVVLGRLTAAAARRPHPLSGMASAAAIPGADYYRADGVRITHDPYAPGMATKYGRQGETDPEGFDPYADSVVRRGVVPWP